MKILLGAIYPYAFFLLYLIIPFDNYIRALPNILLGVLVLAFPFIVSKENFNKLKRTPVALFFLFLVFLVLNAIVFGRLETDFNIIKKVLISLGLLVLYLPIHDAGKIKKAIIFSSLAAIVFSIINIIIVNNTSGDFIYDNYPQLVESLLIDRIYLGFLGVLSILVSCQSYKPQFHPENRYYVVNIIINVLFLMLIGSKIALLILLFVVILRQFYGRHKRIRMLITLFIITGGALLFIAVKDDVRKQDFLKDRTQTEKSFIKNTLTWDIRTVVWHCASLISEETGFNLKGLGFTGTKDKLVTCYAEEIDSIEKREKFVSERYNTHNQFVDFYLSAGFFGILLFVLLLIVLFVENRKNFFATALLLVLTSYCFMENIFHRQLGGYYAGFVLILLLTENWRLERDKKNKKG